MRWTILISFTFLIFEIVIGQKNLIPNPGFEDFYTCNYSNNTILNLREVLHHWKSREFSSKYFNLECLTMGTVEYANDFPKQFCDPSEGNGFLAAVLNPRFIGGVGFREYRSYIEVRLLDTLKKGFDYYISYDLTIPLPNRTPLSHYGIYFSDTLYDMTLDPNNYGPILLQPQIEIDTVPDLKYGEWQKFSHCFTAEDDHTVMTVGIFAHMDSVKGTENILFNTTFLGYDNYFLAEIEQEVRLDSQQYTICAGDCITISSNHSLIPGEFVWSLPGSNAISSRDSVVTVCYDTPGTYDIFLDVEHCTGRYEGTFVGAVTVLPAISHMPILDTTICAGASVTINLPIQFEVIWSDGSSISTRVLQDKGTYSYILSNGACQDTVSFDVKYLIDPSYQKADIFSCPSDSTQFLGKNYAVPGAYRDTLKSINGCDSIYFDIIYQYFEDRRSTILGDLGVCPERGTVISVFDEVFNLEWQDGNRDKDRIITEPGTYILKYNDKNLCKYIDTFQITAYPSPDVVADNLLDIWYAPGILLPVSYSGDIMSYQWNNEDAIDCSQCPYPALIRPKEGVYQITVANEHGCTDADELLVRFKNVNFALPNIIAKKSSAGNHIFYIKSEIDFKYKMSIYDRWGNKIFSNTAISNDAAQGWLPNESIQPGVYVYLISYIENEKEVVMGGDVTVIE
jgi:hypothetical protein